MDDAQAQKIIDDLRRQDGDARRSWRELIDGWSPKMLGCGSLYELFEKKDLASLAMPRDIRDDLFRSMVKSSIPGAKVARLFGVDPATVSRVVNRPPGEDEEVKKRRPPLNNFWATTGRYVGETLHERIADHEVKPEDRAEAVKVRDQLAALLDLLNKALSEPPTPMSDPVPNKAPANRRFTATGATSSRKKPVGAGSR